MTALILRHWRRDAPLGLLLGLSLMAIVGFLSETGPQDGEAQTQGWRRIDTQALRLQISAGDLQEREALWYHAVPAEPAGAPGLGGR